MPAPRTPTCAARLPGLRQRLAGAAGQPAARRSGATHPVTGQVAESGVDARHACWAWREAPCTCRRWPPPCPWPCTEAARGRFEPLLGLSAALTAAGRMPDGRGHALFGGLRRRPAAAGAKRRQPGADFGEMACAAVPPGLCTGWPRGAVPPAFYTLPPAPAATLVLSGGADPVTPPRHGACEQGAGRQGAACGGGAGRPWCDGPRLHARRAVPLPRRRLGRRGPEGGCRLRPGHPAAAGLPATASPRGGSSVAHQGGARHDRSATVEQALHAGPRPARHVTVQAVDRRELHRRQRLHHRPAGPERRRQDHHLAHRRRADRARRGHVEVDGIDVARQPRRRWRAWACSATPAACTRA
jgi:hypothetical protein